MKDIEYIIIWVVYSNLYTYFNFDFQYAPLYILYLYLYLYYILVGTSASLKDAVACTGPSAHACPAGSGMISGQTGCYACDMNTYNDGSSLYCMACPMYQKALSRGSSECSYYKNFVTYKGKRYATLADTPVDGQGRLRHLGYLPLMNSTMIAADDADSRYVISSHSWSTDGLVVTGGCVFGTSQCQGCDWVCDSSYLQRQGDKYAVSYSRSSLEILITCKYIFFCIFWFLN